MKLTYILIALATLTAAAIGASVATLHRAPAPDTAPVASVSPDRPSPAASATPDRSTVSPTASPTAVPSPEKSPEQRPEQPSEKLSERDRLLLNGIGPVHVGMTVAEAAKASGFALVTEGEVASPGCAYYTLQGGPQTIGFMVTDRQIARVDIWRESHIQTGSGAMIGATEADIKALYPGQIEVTPHPYVQGGHYLTYVPKDSADRNYRLVFETDAQGRVTQFRSGRIPEVMWIEGCA